MFVGGDEGLGGERGVMILARLPLGPPSGLGSVSGVLLPASMGWTFCLTSLRGRGACSAASSGVDSAARTWALGTAGRRETEGEGNLGTKGRCDEKNDLRFLTPPAPPVASFTTRGMAWGALRVSDSVVQRQGMRYVSTRVWCENGWFKQEPCKMTRGESESNAKAKV